MVHITGRPVSEATSADLRPYLLAHGKNLTAGVAWLAGEYECSEQAVWKWLSGENPMPGWLRRELAKLEARP